MTDIIPFPALIFYFMVYAFFGWLLENFTSLATKGTFFKANFMKGPFKPMYGLAPVILLIMIRPEMKFPAKLFLCLLIPTVVEYTSGWLLETFFKRKWWDYSRQPFHLHGHICPAYSLCWLFLAMICLTYIQPVMIWIYLSIEKVWLSFYPIILIYFIIEMLLAIKRHLPEQVGSSQPST